MNQSASMPKDFLSHLRRLSRSSREESSALIDGANELLERVAARPDSLLDGLELLSDLIRDDHHGPAVGKGLHPGKLEEIGWRLVEWLQGGSPEPVAQLQRSAWHWLDLLRQPSFISRIEGEERRNAWLELILALVDASRYTIGSMFAMRVATYGPRTFLREPEKGGEGRHSWIEIATQVDRISKGLLALDERTPTKRVAILSENCLQMALFDLACLTTGFVDIMIPAHNTETDVAYILDHLDANVAVVSTPGQLMKIQKTRSQLPKLERIITFFDPESEDPSLISLGTLVGMGGEIDDQDLQTRRSGIDLQSLATIMVTSGTTGKPKGIRFSHRNLVAKRFARSLALPEIGDHDVFLCYLPLFHTFGRYFELLGCLFWGATYTFLLDPSREGLLDAFREAEPSVFISIPKKWLQLQEEIGRHADLEQASDEEVLAASRKVLGPRLRWGLSAAGYLPAEVFRFFQRQGVELMSGFGMTEATGGITMTPPGGYRDDTLGVALPGIDLKLGNDGELMMRGSYVMMGYVGQEGETGVDEEGWVRTGDLMRRDEAGFLRIIDRKKEIYKNIKGETIAPQRVENLFRDFDSVARVFLVGDHREYNTVLIVPNMQVEDIDLKSMASDELKAYFRSLVVSVNRFLAPFERIVDFTILDRDFSAERGELTPKGTFRRKVIAENFSELIESMYRRVRFRLHAKGPLVTVPNWLYQVLGWTAHDVRLEGDHLFAVPSAAKLVIEPTSEGNDLLRIGSCVYRFSGRELDLGTVLTSPELWLGNEELAVFAQLDSQPEIRRRRAPKNLEMIYRFREYSATAEDEKAIRDAIESGQHSLAELDLAARMLGSVDERHTIQGIRLLEKVVSSPDPSLGRESLAILRTAARAKPLVTRRRAFRALFPVEVAHRARRTVQEFLAAGDLLDEGTIDRLAGETTSPAVLDALVETCDQWLAGGEPADSARRRRAATSVLGLLAEYGARHPGVYKRLRWALSRMQAFAEERGVEDLMRQANRKMQEGFRRWLGSPTRIAVDPETGDEYRWEDVITFEDEMNEEDRNRALGLIRGTNFVREAVFLFTGRIIRLSDIPLGGMWVSLLGEKHGKAVYRLTIHTRLQGSYDIAINVNRELAAETVEEETLWLVVAGEEKGGQRLVEDFGGYWRQYDSWSEEFVAGETVNRFIGRLSRQRTVDAENRLKAIWPFVVWSAAEAYLEFWDRTRRRFVIADPAGYNVIVPTHDFQVGPRIVSVSEREAFGGLGQYLSSLWVRLVEAAEETHPVLRGVAAKELIYSALVETVGVDQGLALLREMSRLQPDQHSAIEEFCGGIERLGFVPKRLHFAISRYHRWAELAVGATPQARARMIQDLFGTYNLASLVEEYPAARVRFYRETVFLGAAEDFRRELDRVIIQITKGGIDGDQLVELVGSLRQYIEDGSEEEYFLTRLTYPHLRPGDLAELVFTEAGGTRQADVVVVQEDTEGRPFRIRHPVSPKEVGRLHKLFLSAKLEVTFRPEHQYLVAVNQRDALIGGIFYEVDKGGHRAHLEKIVVVERVRKHGISDGLMNELFNRLRVQGIQAVTTGFFRPSYFYRFGFRIEKGYAGLVKDLVAETPKTPDLSEI